MYLESLVLFNKQDLAILLLNDDKAIRDSD